MKSIAYLLINKSFARYANAPGLPEIAEKPVTKGGIVLHRRWAAPAEVGLHFGLGAHLHFRVFAGMQWSPLGEKDSG